MFKEITLTEAFERFKNGENGIVIRQSDDGFEVMAFEKFFSGIPNGIRFLADVEEEQKVTDPFERYEKYGPAYKPEKKKRHRPNQKEIEQNILKAWDCGNRSFDEVVKRTGYSAKTVERFLPHNCKA